MALVTGHIGINVTDLQRSSAFYANALGLQHIGGSTEGGQKFAFLGDGTRLLLTLWEQSSGQFSATTPGLHHLAFSVDSMDEVRAAESRLRSAGAKFIYNGAVAHAEGRDSGGIFFEDPDGTRLEISTSTGAGKLQAPTGAAPSCGFF
jgi:lactoylglutathione lyase